MRENKDKPFVKSTKDGLFFGLLEVLKIIKCAGNFPG